ncbi:sugar ABC transporter substrate-binding protein [Mesobacillus foraminis]|uniref:sugar ABC transporter substrate-binding protein n=1 Tax=Mesobacillus foraminis TaxID=279826 RepID=UPI00214A974E|nr:substrate-binding domain-containing protein [Mesobacillus foraminis]
MKYRRILFSLLAVILLASAAGCSSSQNEEHKASAKARLITEDEKVYVGFILDTLQDERWYRDKELFETHVKELGAEVKTLAANGSTEVQISQAELLIAEGVDVLVVVPYDAEAAAEIVELAHKAEVKVVSYDRLINNADVDYYVSFDNEKVGELQASEIVKKKNKGKFAYIGGAETDNNAVLFRNGAMKVLQHLIDKGDIELVYDQYTEKWDPAVAERNMKEALKKEGNQIDAVVAANDGTAGGVIKALSASGLDGKIPVSGQDAELEGVRRVYKGTQTMTVYKPIVMLAKNAAEVAVKAGRNENIATETSVHNGKADVPSILLDPIAVTKDNIQDTVVKDGYLDKKDITGE